MYYFQTHRFFENVKNNCYTLLGGFNVLEEDEMNTEVILGASDTIYVSENNFAKVALRTAKELNATEEDWKDFIDKLKVKK